MIVPQWMVFVCGSAERPLLRGWARADPHGRCPGMQVPDSPLQGRAETAKSRNDQATAKYAANQAEFSFRSAI